jgi:signal transduction histidine kinase
MTSRAQILIVDDRPENLIALRQALAGIDADVVSADSGNEALKATLHHEFAVAILDIMMPGMDGYELAALLRGDTRTRALPIIFLTAAAGEDAQVFKGYESGAVDYIVKPYNADMLLAKVRVFLELNRKNVALIEQMEALAAAKADADAANRAMHAAHQARQEEMEKQVRAAVGALIAQRAELARVERLAALGELAASLAHELRNPLAGIRAACRSLLADVEDPDISDRLQLVTAEVDRLVDLVNQQLQRAHNKPEELKDVDLAPLVTSIVALVRYQMPDGVDLRTDLPPSLPARLPPNGFRQALLNLLRNAQQAATGHGGVVTVSGAANEREIQVCVEDEGPGFPPEILSDGIRRFVSTWQGGTGLGLAMVQRFAQDLGGRLEMENRVEGGARVRIVVPVNDSR